MVAFDSMITGLPRHCFTCDTTFRKELEKIAGRHWMAAGTLDDFGEPTAAATRWYVAELAGYSVIVIRQPSGKLTAFHNVCRHRGTRLLDDRCGELKNDCITCPYHAWSYDAHGQLIGAPNMTGVADFERSGFSLLPVSCFCWAGQIFLHPGNAPQADFRQAWAPLLLRLENWQMDDLRLCKTLRYDVRANWKLIFQNYSECYHCPTVHPDLNQQTPYKTASNDLTEGPVLGGPMQLADGVETVSRDGRRVASPFPGLSKIQTRSVYYYTVFPNAFVSAHPDYVMIHQLRAVDAGRTVVHCHFLAAANSTGESLERAWKMWDAVNRQDWRVCELTQQGVASPAFRPGPYSGLESMLAAFDRHYLRVMEAE